MDILDFVKNLIENKSGYELTKEDEKCVAHEGIRKFIFNKINSSKYRASSIGQDYQQKVVDKIELCVNHDQPIYFTLPFGATKNPYLPTAPGIDWAEVFNISYFRDYLKPIAKAYKHGVILDYISVAVFEEKVNRIPKKDTDIYDSQFEQLIKVFQKLLPSNFTLRYTRTDDLIPRGKIEHQLEVKMAELKKSWNKQSKEVIEYKLKKARRNSLYDSKDKHLDQLILDSALGHDAFCSECWTTDAAPWDKKNMITLGHTYTKGWAVHLRSAAGSTVNFWSGIGLLVNMGQNFVPTVFSPSQFNEFSKNVSQVPFNYFDKKFTNLQNIWVLNK